MKSDRYQYLIDTDVNCIFIRHTGLVNQDIIIQRGEEVSRATTYRPNLNRLIDLRGCDIDLNRDALMHVVNMMQKASISRGSYTELLLVDSLLAHGVVRMLLSLMDDREVSYTIMHASDPELEVKIRISLGFPRDFRIPSFISMPSSKSDSESTTVSD